MQYHLVEWVGLFALIIFILLIFSACITLYLSHICWKRRKLPVARTSSVAMFAATLYTAFELRSGSLEEALFWLRVEYLGISFITTLWLITPPPRMLQFHDVVQKCTRFIKKTPGMA